MRFGYSITFYLSWIAIYIAIRLFKANGSEPQENGLVLLHVLFRHGDRTPNGPEELYPTDPYRNETYYPVGLGQLTLAGKKREFALGEALRGRYNHFLGPVYYPEIVDARSTDYNRTKMSLELVLAGLFPPTTPEEVWNPNLKWQPIPYNYYPRTKDEILIGVYCPTYLKLYDEFIRSPQFQAELKKSKDVFDYISKNTGSNITSYQDIYNLYFGLAAEEGWGFKLPPWTKKVWPKIITDLAIRDYYAATATTNLKRMATGYFLQKIIDDTTATIEGKNKGKKIYLYSAHENNIAELLLVLGVFHPPHIPNYGAYVVFEVHKLQGSYGIKIYYVNGDLKKLQLLKLPHCDFLCDFKKFIYLLKENLPSPGLCGNGDCLVDNNNV